MGKLYWFLNVNGEENLSGAVKVYRKILDERENVVLLSAKEIRQAHRYPFDEADSDEAWLQSEERDLMMARYLIEQDIDVVYCSPCEFQEIKEWAQEKITEVVFITEDEKSVSDGSAVPSREAGTMYWITGLSGAGKTTVGKILYQKMRSSRKNVLLMDGDMFRDAMHIPRDYSREAREQLSYRNVRLAKMLVEKGIDIIWCTICMFEGVREWNRKNIENYFEIYLEVPMNVLEGRRVELYKGAREGTIENVVGVNQEAEYPRNPDILICNDGSRLPEDIAGEIWQSLHPWQQVSDESELQEVLGRLKKQIEFSLYTYIDLVKYGLHDDSTALYSIEPACEDKGAVIALKYHNGLNLVGEGNSYDGKRMMRLVKHVKPSIISGRLDVVEALHKELKGQYNMESGYVLKWAGKTPDSADPEVERAALGDCREIAQLIMGEDSIGSYYELEDMTQQLTQRMEEGMGRNYLIRREGKIVSHCATYAELEDIAVIAGVITSPEYRHKGLFQRIFLTLVNDLSQEGKDIYLFAFGEALPKMYEKLGMKIVGEWGRLVKDAV